MTRVRLALALAGLWLMTTASSCATTGEPPVKTVIVNVPVAVSCVPADMPPAPVAPLTAAQLMALPDSGARYQALAVFWAAWSPWLPAAIGVLDNCAKAGPAPTGTSGHG